MNKKLIVRKYTLYVLGLVIITTLLLLFLDIIDITRFIKLSSKYDWLSYFGAILGGLITFLGVIITIKYEREIRKEELSITYRPIIMPSGENPYLKEGYNIKRYFTQNYENYKGPYKIIPLLFRNGGRGETRNIRLNYISIIDFPVKSFSKLKSDTGKLNMEEQLGDVLCGEFFIIYVYLPQTLYTSNNKIINESFKIEVSLSYSDIYDYNNYTDTFQVLVEIDDSNYKSQNNTKNKNKLYVHRVTYKSSLNIRTIR